MKRKNFETILKSCYGGHTQKKDYVIKNEGEWAKLWNTTNSISSPIPGVPGIDFGKEMVIAVYQGNFRTGGYSIEIVNITETEDQLEVRVEETSPNGGMILTQTFSQPYHIVKTEKVEKKVKFSKV